MTKSFTSETLLGHLLAAIGLGSAGIGAVAACGGSEAAGRDAAPVDANFDSNSMGGAGGADGETPPNGGSGGIPPIGTDSSTPDAPLPCGAFDVRPATADDGCSVDSGSSDRYVHLCFPLPTNGVACADAYKNCFYQASRCSTEIQCGPFPSGMDACCYVVGPCVPPPPGRPFIVAGKARVAAAGTDASWAASLRPETEGIDGETRTALAEFWTEEALTEHASVASFSRFVLQCLSLGAPADIVVDAQRACTDEIEHARIGFGLASAYAGRVIGPGRLDIEDALEESIDPVDIARGVAAEGCVAELVSAALLGAARDAAGDPVVRAALAKMADEELAHATLAWRYVRWAFAEGGDRLRRAVTRVFEEMDRHVAFGARTARPLCEERMRAHGYVPWQERRRIAERVLAQVVRPAARALFVATDRAVAGEFAGQATLLPNS